MVRLHVQFAPDGVVFSSTAEHADGASVSLSVTACEMIHAKDSHGLLLLGILLQLGAMSERATIAAHEAANADPSAAMRGLLARLSAAGVKLPPGVAEALGV